jgi:hypothetical protein
VKEGGVQVSLACCTTIPPRSRLFVKISLVTEGCNKILKSEFPKTVVLEPVEIRMVWSLAILRVSSVESAQIPI